jgi:hypothetical protein
MNFLAQITAPTNFWTAPQGSTALLWRIIIAFVVGCGIVIGISYLPKNLRRPTVTTVTFLGGLYFVMHYLWPTAQDYSKAEIPRGTTEVVSFWLQGTLPTVTSFMQILGALMFGLGISSLLRIHITQLVRKHRDWFFSLTLLTSMAVMLFFGFWNWRTRLGPGAEAAVLSEPKVFPHFAYDFLFNGLFMNLDAVMFSIIAFYIFSAAYRSFRLRSVESTILLGTALLVMLSLMGGVLLGWDRVIDSLGSPGGLMDNLRLGVIKDWVQNNLQSPSIRAMEFGLAIGGLAMSLRLWLSIEKGVSH